MNLQDILGPIGDAMTWTFELLMEGEPGFAHWFNWTVIILGGLGFIYWIKKQGDFNKEAARSGKIA